ncbi:glutathione S-transferase [Protomyces lactucae-debilis]|uniref:Glutathione S-transferase n=1 Tax=Protomyces lactucae-debilis TaxID=2754530 RepID=A0A1Y2FUM9_PROLT|nr:glutathione S-transferase [Protomyces lactucae-debilis]ORY86896.1 glutathione S-transferase [Protomyces lactucae-debilis]
MSIELLTAPTPNGHKISILLEELGLEYTVKNISFNKNEQKSEEFLGKFQCKNGRIPGIVDKTEGANNYGVTESGAIMIYLTDKYDKDNKLSFSYGTTEYWDVVQWMFFMNAGLGPMQGQANHFFRYAPEKIQYGITRYQNETRRLYGVLEQRLKETGDWLVGGKYTIADIANFSWVNMAFWAGVDVEEFPNVVKWTERIEARPATKKGLDVPTEFTLKEKYKNDPKSVEEHAARSAAWVQQSNKELEK